MLTGVEDLGCLDWWVEEWFEELEVEWRSGVGEKLERTKDTPWLMDLLTGVCSVGMW